MNWNRTFISAMSAAALAIALAPNAPALPQGEPIAPGVVHTGEVVNPGPLNFQVLKVDLAEPRLAVKAAKTSGKLFAGEKVASLADKQTSAVIGAVNADFWTHSPRPFLPIGPFVSEGMIWYLPQAQMDRSAFAINRDRQTYFGLIHMNITVDTAQRRFAVPRVNDARATGGLVLVTPPIGEKVALGGPYFNWVTLKMQGDEFLPNQSLLATVKSVDPNPPARLPRGELALALDRKQPADTAAFTTGSAVHVSAQVPELPGVITDIVGGGPLLVRNGKLALGRDKERFGKKFISERHPRTALGITRDRRTLYLVTVDGRQPLVSIGMSLPDLAAYMLKLGCWDAMNLDGGGSTTMLVRGEVTNSPSDLIGPRTVCNALMVMSNVPAGALAQLAIRPKGVPLRVPAGTAVSLSAAGFDANSNPVRLDPATVTWTGDPSLGSILGSGTAAELKTATSRARGNLTVSAGGITGTQTISVVPTDTVKTEPRMLLLAPGESSSLRVEAVGGGAKLLLQPEMIAVGNADGILSASRTRVTALKPGLGQLEVRVGTGVARIPVAVDRYRSEMVNTFDSAFAKPLSGKSYDTTRTRLTNSPDARQGSASLKLDYAMTRGGQTRIILPMKHRLAKPPVKLGMWIKGDGKEAWVRGTITDAAGKKFLFDFTEGSKGVYWKDEWRRVSAPATTFRPDLANPEAKIKYPVTVTDLYVAQDQEALKASGTLLLDGFEAVYPTPEMEKAKP